MPYVKLYRRPVLLCYIMVRTGSAELNHPKQTRNYPMILVTSGPPWFEDAQ